jgi:hypothetical protein
MPLTAEHGLLALAVARSNNEKIGDCATTYAAQASCPASCAFFNGGGCYAENGRIYSGITKPLNGAAELAAAGPREVALEEAAAIDALEMISNRPMRLHTVGDCRTDEAARIVSSAAERYMDRGGGPVWTYTHAWRIVDRDSWGRVSVLASCETAEQIELARMRGYAPSIVVSEFGQRTKYVHRDIEILPCPAQTSADVTCSSCRLCMDDTGLRGRGYAIAFEVHGTASSVRQASRALASPSDPDRRQTSRDVALAYHAEHGYWPFPATLARLAGVRPTSAREMLGRLRSESAPAVVESRPSTPRNSDAGPAPSTSR